MQENLVVDDYEDEKIVDFQVNESFPTASAIQNPCFSNEEINLMISQLNQNQRQIFNVVNTWARQRVQNRSSRNPLKIPPLRLFITGNAGTRKSFLIKTLYLSISKTLNFRTSSVEKPKVCALRIKYEELKMIIVDEISMVSNKLMLYIHQRLVDIFGYAENSSVPFAGITMIFVGDLYQPSPVLQKPIYADYYDEILNMYHLWRTFKFCELTEVMRQRERILYLLISKQCSYW